VRLPVRADQRKRFIRLLPLRADERFAASGLDDRLLET